MNSFSELENNKYLHHFRNKIRALDTNLHVFNKNNSEEEERFTARLELYSMMESFPIYMLEKIHPEQVFLCLERILTNFQPNQPERFSQADHSTLLNARNWNRFIRENICLQLDHFLLKELISQFPVMTDWYRFPSVNWKYLPFMNWEKVILLQTLIQQEVGKFYLGEFFQKEWILLPDNIQNISLTWIRFKMQPGIFQQFEQSVKDENVMIEEHIHRKALKVLGFVMAERECV
ncbi:MAG: hypothetical protein WBM02_01780 [bacterium]